MPRRRIYIRYEQPESVVRIVEAIIADYPRRERMIAYSTQDDGILTEYKRLNNIVDDAINSIEPHLCSIIRGDIIDHIGYERSRAACISSKGAYYRRKHKFVHDIAVALSLA